MSEPSVFPKITCCRVFALSPQQKADALHDGLEKDHRDKHMKELSSSSHVPLTPGVVPSERWRVGGVPTRNSIYFSLEEAFSTEESNTSNLKKNKKEVRITASSQPGCGHHSLSPSNTLAPAQHLAWWVTVSCGTLMWGMAVGEASSWRLLWCGISAEMLFNKG